MNIFQAIVIAIVEGITEFLPISSTAHMIFVSALFGIEQDDFVKMYQVSIQLGAILAVIVAYWQKFFDFKSFDFYIKLGLAVVPALILGKFFDDKIEAVLEKPIPIAIVMVVGGIVLLFIDRYFQNPTIEQEKDINIFIAIKVGFWQCLAMMPGTSRAAASIIGGMQQGMTRKVAAEFSFFLAVPTMLAVCMYSVFLKDWNTGGIEQKGYELILQSNGHILQFFLGNAIAFVVALFAIKNFISLIQKYGFKIWGWYRILLGIIVFFYFYFFNN